MMTIFYVMVRIEKPTGNIRRSVEYSFLWQLLNYIYRVVVVDKKHKCTDAHGSSLKNSTDVIKKHKDENEF